MYRLPKNVLLTGPPGCGKAKVIRRVIERWGKLRLTGFYAQEIRQHGQRLGFDAIGLSGQRATLAHVTFHSTRRVGRYGVNLQGFDTIIHTELGKPPDRADLFVIDKMECMSQVFVEAVTCVLDAFIPMLMTIAAKGGIFIVGLKTPANREIVTVTSANRDHLPTEPIPHNQEM